MAVLIVVLFNQAPEVKVDKQVEVIEQVDKQVEVIEQDKAAVNEKPQEIESMTMEEIKEQVLSESAYKNLVKAYQEDKLTEPIYNEFIKVVAFVNQPKLCWELAQELRQECIERVYILQAKREDDTEICEKIATPAWKDECYAQVLTRRAEQQEDPAICEQIKKLEDRVKCRNEF